MVKTNPASVSKNHCLGFAVDRRNLGCSGFSRVCLSGRVCTGIKPSLDASLPLGCFFCSSPCNDAAALAYRSLCPLYSRQRYSPSSCRTLSASGGAQEPTASYRADIAENPSDLPGHACRRVHWARRAIRSGRCCGHGFLGAMVQKIQPVVQRPARKRLAGRWRRGWAGGCIQRSVGRSCIRHRRTGALRCLALGTANFHQRISFRFYSGCH